jgi:hypothetical protein
MVLLVGKSHQKFALGETEKVGCHVPLNVFFIPNLSRFAGSVDFSNGFVKIRASVHVLP